MPRLKCALVCIAVALVWLGSLGLRPMYKPDEGRYAEIPREMAASGDWVTPRLNGFKYLEKPPLQYWATAAAYRMFGVSDWAARLWLGLAALAGVAMTFCAANRLFGPPAGPLSAAILATSPLYVLMGQINTLDMGVTFFLSAAVFAFLLAQHAPARARRWMLGFWAACAAAVLSKGLIGIVLPLGAVALYVLVRRDWALLRRLELVRGGLLFLVIASPWFIAVSIANEEFAHFFFIQEHLQRYTTHMHKREHAAWFFVPVLVFGMWPWLAAAAAGWLGALRSSRGDAFSPRLFLALWAAMVFAFFSVSGSKLIPYILPIFPALAMLGGAYLAEQRGNRLLFAQALLVAAGGAALLVLALWLSGPGGATIRGQGASAALWFGIAALSALAAGAAAAVFARRGVALRAFSILALGAAGMLAAAFGALWQVAPAYSASPLIASLPRPPSSEAQVFTVETYDHTIPWALRRTVTMVMHKDELTQAIAWEPQRFVPDLEAFRRAWNAAPEAYAFFAINDFERLRRELELPMEVVGRSRRYVMVKKPP